MLVEGPALRRPSQVLLSATAHYSLLPLIFRPTEYALSRVLVLLSHCATVLAMRTRCAAAPGAPPAAIGLMWYERVYLAGFLPLEAFTAALHPALVAPRLPFLPLMCTSVYCAVGVHYSCVLAFRLIWT